MSGFIQRLKAAMQQNPTRPESSDAMIFNKRNGGYDIYGGLDVRSGEMPAQAKRRADLQAAMIGQGDSTTEGAAMFAPPGEREGPLDYTPSNVRPKNALQQRLSHSPLGTQPPRPAGIPANAHWDAHGIGPEGGEWIAPPQDPSRSGAPTGQFNPQPPPPVTTDLGVFTEGGKRSTFTEGGTGTTHDRRTQPRDLIADDEAALRQLENQRDPFWKRAVIAGINAAQAGFGDKPTPISTSRTRDMERMQTTLGRDVKVAGERARIEAGEMVPVELDNGEVVYTSRKGAGGLRSRQQEIGLRSDKQDAQVERWRGMTARDRRRDIAGLYKSGALNTPQGLEYAARELDIPVEMKPAFIAGQMRDGIDGEGNFVQINRQTGASTPTGVKSYETVKEGGRNRRTTQQQQGALVRTQANQQGANQRAGMQGNRATPKLGEDTKKDIAKGYGEYEQYHVDLNAIEEKIRKVNALPADWKDTDGTTKNDELSRLSEDQAKKIAEIKQRMATLNQLDPETEWGSGERGYPYRKPKGGGGVQSDLDQPIYGKPKAGGRTIEGAIAAFKKNRKLNPTGRAPTAEEIANMKAALGQ